VISKHFPLHVYRITEVVVQRQRVEYNSAWLCQYIYQASRKSLQGFRLYSFQPLHVLITEMKVNSRLRQLQNNVLLPLCDENSCVVRSNSRQNYRISM
jgi:hypothetical protein